VNRIDANGDKVLSRTDPCLASELSSDKWDLDHTYLWKASNYYVDCE